MGSRHGDEAGDDGGAETPRPLDVLRRDRDPLIVLVSPRPTFRIGEQILEPAYDCWAVTYETQALQTGPDTGTDCDGGLSEVQRIREERYQRSVGRTLDRRRGKTDLQGGATIGADHHAV
jgi:hypothetical protein